LAKSWSTNIDTRIYVGDAIKMDKKEIYVVSRVTILKWGETMLACWSSPLALLVTEGGLAYPISLTDEEITIDCLLAMAPALKGIVEKQAKVGVG
jgi:hypothetical protein